MAMAVRFTFQDSGSNWELEIGTFLGHIGCYRTISPRRKSLFFSCRLGTLSKPTSSVQIWGIPSRAIVLVACFGLFAMIGECQWLGAAEPHSPLKSSRR